MSLKICLENDGPHLAAKTQAPAGV